MELGLKSKGRELYYVVTGHFLSLGAFVLETYRERGGDVSASRQKELIPIIIIIKTLANVVTYTIS